MDTIDFAMILFLCREPQRHFNIDIPPLRNTAMLIFVYPLSDVVVWLCRGEYHLIWPSANSKYKYSHWNIYIYLFFSFSNFQFTVSARSFHLICYNFIYCTIAFHITEYTMLICSYDIFRLSYCVHWNIDIFCVTLGNLSSQHIWRGSFTAAMGWLWRNTQGAIVMASRLFAVLK